MVDTRSGCHRSSFMYNRNFGSDDGGVRRWLFLSWYSLDIGTCDDIELYVEKVPLKHAFFKQQVSYRSCLYLINCSRQWTVLICTADNKRY